MDDIWKRAKVWRASLKAGDEVVITYGYHSDGKLVAVARVTDKQIIIDDHLRFWRENGRKVGGSESFSRTSLDEATPEARGRIRKAELVAKVEHFKWRELSLEDLEKVEAVLSSAPKK